MKKVSLLFVLLLSISFLASCSGGSKKSTATGDVVGKVGNESVTWKEFKEQLDALPQYYRQFLQRGNAKEGFLKKQLIKKAMVLEAEARGYDKDTKIINQLKRMKEQLLIRKLMDAERKKKVTVSDDRIKKYYDEHKNEFQVKDEVKIRHILIKLPKNATAKQEKEALTKIKKVLKELKRGAKFEALVKKYSEDNTTKMSKGELPFFSKDRKLRNYMDEVFMSEAFKLKKIGDNSGIVKTGFGYEVIELIDKHSAKQKDFIEVAPKIKRKLEEQGRVSQRKELEESLSKKYHIEVYKDVLKKVSGSSVVSKPPIKIKRPVTKPTKVQVPINNKSKKHAPVKHNKEIK